VCGQGTSEGERAASKTEKFFVWQFSKIDKRNVWDILAEVRRLEVARAREEHTRSVAERGTSDFRLGSKSPKSRRHMFGKGGPRPKAQATVK